MSNWIEPDKKRKSVKKDQQPLRSSVKKRQIVIKKDGQSFTRYEEDGRMRSIDCPHGVTCKSCFVKTGETHE